MKAVYSVIAALCLVACIYAAPVLQDSKAKEVSAVSQQQQQKPNEDAKSKATVSVSQFKQQKNLEQQLSGLSDTPKSKDVTKPVTKPAVDDTATPDEQNEQLLDEIASLRPRAVAEYLLTTGNWEMFEDVLTDLVNSQLVTEEEAQVFYDDVNMEYEQAMMEVLAAEGDSEGELGNQESEVVPEQQAEEYYSDAEEDDSNGADSLMASPVDDDSDNSDSSSAADEEELNELLTHLMNEQQAEEVSDAQQPEEELEAVAAEAAGEQTAESELEELANTQSKVKVAAPQQSQPASQVKPSTSQGQKSESN